MGEWVWVSVGRCGWMWVGVGKHECVWVRLESDCLVGSFGLGF